MTRMTSMVLVVVSALCFATLAVFTSLAYRAGAQPLQLLTWRFALAALLLGGWVLATNPRGLRIPSGDLARYATLAIFGYGAASLCFFFALRFASASVVAVLLYTYPAMVALASAVLLRERLRPARIVGVVVTFLGCALVLDVFGAASGTTWQGIALGMGAAAGYTSFNMLSHRWLPGRSRTVLMGYTFGITAVGMAVVAVVSGSRLAPIGWAPATLPGLGVVPGGQVWLLLAAIVVFPTFLAVVLYLQALRGLGPTPAAILSTFEPVFTVLLAARFLGERFHAVQWVGMACVIVGVVIAESGDTRADPLAAV